MNMEALKVKPNPKLPRISPGDSVKVSFRVKEAGRERTQIFTGLVVRTKRTASGGNFTIRKVANGVGVEHTFPFASPLLEKINVTRHGKVRRAKLYYIRRLSAKESRLKERREKIWEGAVAEAVPVVEEPQIVEDSQETEIVASVDTVETAEENVVTEEAEDTGEMEVVDQSEDTEVAAVSDTVDADEQGEAIEASQETEAIQAVEEDVAAEEVQDTDETIAVDQLEDMKVETVEEPAAIENNESLSDSSENDTVEASAENEETGEVEESKEAE
jgi:large subunit ribosomal protein L19